MAHEKIGVGIGIRIDVGFESRLRPRSRRLGVVESVFRTALGLMLVLWQGGCVREPAARGDAVDLTGLFQLEGGIPEEAAENSFRRDVPVERAGEMKISLVLIAPATVRAQLPAMAGAIRLQAMTAPVFNIGDGFELEVALRRLGAREVLYSRYYDPARVASDRNWAPLAVDFRADGGEDLALEMNLSGGPQGDLITDWLAVASPRLLLDRRSK
jgi:hypothetical protein